MFGIGIDAQLQLQRPYECVSMLDASLWGDADNVFRFGDTSLYPNYAFTICHWYYCDSESGIFNYTTGRETTSSNRQHQILIYHDRSASSLNFMTGVGATAYNLILNTPTILPKNKWYFVAVSATALSGQEKKDLLLFDESGLVVSGRTTGSANYPSITSNNNFRYLVGAARNGAGQSAYDMRQNSHGVWNIYQTPDFIRGIWNYGRGLQYDDLTATQKTNLVEWWNLNDWDGTDCTGSVLGENLVRATIGTTNIAKVEVLPNIINPSTISGLVAWYGDTVNTGVTRTTLSNGNAITRWDDQSGNGYHLNTLVGTPTYNSTTKGIVLNTTSAIARTTSFPITGQTSSIFVIMKVNSADGSNNTDVYHFFLGNDVTNYYAPVNRQNANSVNIQNLSTQRIYGTPAQIELNETSIHTFINADNTPANYIFRKNGITFTPSTAGVGTIPTHAAKVIFGGYFNAGTPTAYNITKNVDMIEVLFYNRQLTTAEIVQVESYLQKKYLEIN